MADNNAASNNDNGNGKVTLAVLGTKLDEVLRRLDSIDRCIEDHDKRIQLNDRGAVQRDERISELRQDVDRLQSRTTMGDIGASIGVMVAAAIAWFK